MRRTASALHGRSRARLLPALVALAVLLCAPWMVSPAGTQMAACGMGSAAQAPAAATSPVMRVHAAGHRHDAACTAACALCGQLAPARAEEQASPPQAQTTVRYAGLEPRLLGSGPELATPPPR